MKFQTDVFPKDFTTLKGRKYRPSRYYDKLLMRKNWNMYEEVKEKRKERIEEPDIIRRKAMDKYHHEVTQTLHRRFEHGE